MKYFKLLFIAIFFSVYSFGQIGINTDIIDPSAALDIRFDTKPKGLLTPRMTTAERNTIITTATSDGLIVYDTTVKSFFHYNAATSSWVRINSGAAGRTNFKRIQSAADLAAELTAGGTTKYKLSTNTLYEINGTVTLDKPIDLNNAYIQGIDSGDDKITSTGNIFDGATGGTIKGLTLTSSTKVFNLTGTAAQNLIFRDCIVVGSASVGTINNFGLVFLSIVQFAGNTNGITYSNISQLLLSNLGWFGNNSGTFEKLTGTFGLVQKQGGFSDVTSATYGFDVSDNPTISGDAVLESVVFTGTPTGAGSYVKPYTTGTYAGYNFNNKWNVRCAGIPTESDASASGNLYLNRTVTYPTINFGTANSSYKLPGVTISSNLFRTNDGVAPNKNNRLVYDGLKTRTFTVNSSISMQVGGNGVTDFLFFFVKFTASGVGSIVTSSETFIDSNSGYVQSFPVTGIVELSAGEYIELHGARLNGTNKTLTFNSYNMSMK